MTSGQNGKTTMYLNGLTLIGFIDFAATLNTAILGCLSSVLLTEKSTIPIKIMTAGTTQYTAANTARAVLTAGERRSVGTLALAVVPLGSTRDGIETFMDKHAYESDGVMLVGRAICPHIHIATIASTSNPTMPSAICFPTGPPYLILWRNSKGFDNGHDWFGIRTNAT